MGLPVRVLKNVIDSREWAGWKVYYSLEPFGPLREDLRAAIIAASVLNLLRGRNDRTVRPEDIFPSLIEPRDPEGQDWETQLALVEILNAAFGGLDLREPGPPVLDERLRQELEADGIWEP